MKSSFRKTAALLAALIMLLSFTGCAAAYATAATDLMKGVTASKQTEDPQALIKGGAKAADFAVRLFKASYEKDKNTLISPLSVLCALSMTANGAKNNTLAQMEAVLDMSKDELNSFFLSYLNALAAGKNGTLRLANSIWFTDSSDFSVNKDFLQTNADYFGAELYKMAFDGSEKPRKVINSWVKEKTGGMIPEIIDRIPDNIIMYLINALAFDAEWDRIYKKNEVRDGQFTCSNGQTKTVKFMYTDEYEYLETENAVGFIKNYKDCEYAFMALLPGEGSSVSDVISALDGKVLLELLSSPQSSTVMTAIPVFKSDYGIELSGVLADMGMPEAFDESKADFSGMGTADGGIYISRVLHKTSIEVNEKGTKAGAATAVEMNSKGMAPGYIKQVYLDRPFVYMLIDRTTNLPFFIGVMENISD